jgi:hypothetical protein
MAGSVTIASRVNNVMATGDPRHDATRRATEQLHGQPTPIIRRTTPNGSFRLRHRD